jgi:4-hydroxy-4-methyl-2-oxoglutarate aldolase
VPSEQPVADDGKGSRLVLLGASTVAESGGEPLYRRIRPVWPGARLAGRAYTVLCHPGDNLAVHAAVPEAPSGWVLAVSVGGEADHAYWGEVLTVAATHAGLAGIVIDGKVRDTEAIASRKFPVFATGVALRGPSKTAGGSVGQSAEIGGTIVHMGDWLVADADGVVVVDARRVDSVLAAAEARAWRERRLIDALGEGATTVDLLHLSVETITVRGLVAGEGT